jgi:hypothetical protein
MLYTFVLPGIGPGLLWIYAAQPDAAGVGSTGGGQDIRPPAGARPPLGRHRATCGWRTSAAMTC